MLLEQFIKTGKKSSNVSKYQFWRHDNKPIEVWSNKVIFEKINYIHQNPVEEGFHLIPAFNEGLEYYENNRELYLNLEQYFPELISKIKIASKDTFKH